MMETDSKIFKWEDAEEKYFPKENFPFQDETYELIGICMEVHRILGKGLLEIVYKDAIEYELKQKNIPYEREKRYDVNYKKIILQHHFFADFVLHNNIILEIKAKQGIVEEHYAYLINYLAISKIKLGLLVNLGEDSLKFKRLIF
jgi:GxxExxY protein